MTDTFSESECLDLERQILGDSCQPGQLLGDSCQPGQLLGDSCQPGQLLGDSCQSGQLANQAVKQLIRANKMTSEQARDWLSWCSKNSKLKVSKTAVPHGILPLGLGGYLHDVKVFDHGPDDALYNRDPLIRDRVARGNTILELYNSTTKEETMDMVIFALKKFTGGMGDEDENQPEDDLVWKKYFLKDLDEVDEIVVMHKENGEAGHLSVRLIGGQVYYVAGSKNVHLMFRTKEDIAKYVDSRYLVAKTVAEAALENMEGIEESKRSLLHRFMACGCMTGVFEILQPGYQHVVDLSHLARPTLRFLCWTQQYCPPEMGGKPHDSSPLQPPETGGLTSLPPHVALSLGKGFGLETTTYQIIKADLFEQKMAEIRRGYGYEGCVLYFLDSQGRVVGLLKKKTTWYIICRAIREKVSQALSAFKKNPGGFSATVERQHCQRLNKRLEAIEKWLDLSSTDTDYWRTLGTGFLVWSLSQARDNLATREEVNVRGKFPQSWRAYLTATGRSDRPGAEAATAATANHPAAAATAATAGHPAAAGGREERVQLLEPTPASPIIKVIPPSGVVVMSCILRHLDMFGKNRNKAQNILSKVNTRQLKNKSLGSVGVHDLSQVAGTELTFRLEQADMLDLSKIQKSCQPDCTCQTEESDNHKKVFSLRDAEKILSIGVCGKSSLTNISDETNSLLVIVSANTTEIGEKAMSSVLQQFYHAGLGVNFPGKCLTVEKGRVRTDSEIEPVKLFPGALGDF